MDNPQPKVSESEYGWIAGMLDGEGSVMLAIRMKGNKNDAPVIYPLISISGTEIEGLNKFTDVLARVPIGHHVSWTEIKGYMKNGDRYKRAWTIRISGFKRCKAFAQWITPALAIKRARAELLLDYIREREAHSDFRTPITQAELGMALLMRRLNQKGKGQPFTKAVTLNTERPGASSETLAANGLKGAQARWGIRN